ncbi:hypothetical protein [Ruegeria sp.]|uniref:hypothetical protein n=1 Tax=Ruegeria sp. TaxID=1879320 RepID=UPI003C7DF514
MSKDREGGGKPGKGKTNTSLRLEGKTLKALKIRAIEEGTSVQKIVERLVNEYLGAPRKGKS